MRTTLALILLGGAALSCGDEGGGVAVDTRYQLACPADPMETGCGSAADAVDVLGFNGEVIDGAGTVTATCNAIDGADGTKNLSFSFGYGRDPLLSVRGLILSEEGGPVLGSSCQLEARQDGNTYGGSTYGRCGNVVPNEDQPCQFTSFMYDPNGEFGPQLTTTLLCRNLRAPAAPTEIVRDVTLPNMRNTPAQIKLINCQGF